MNLQRASGWEGNWVPGGGMAAEARMHITFLCNMHAGLMIIIHFISPTDILQHQTH